MISKIQRFCINDGPGIRTVVFLKGCPLACKWCCNPETQRPEPELVHNRHVCIGCGSCVAACPRNLVTMTAEGPAVDFAACDACGLCARACPTTAMQICGQCLGVEELFDALLKDLAFFEISGGGVTLSGGEALARPDFAAALLERLKSMGVHTAVETCGAVPWDVLARISPLTDLYLYDIKQLDPNRHESGTGVDNAQILANLDRLVHSALRVIVRFPLIPGYNDEPDHLRAVARLVRELGIEELHLLPYHRLGVAKYAGLGRSYAMGAYHPAQAKEVQAARDVISKNAAVKIVVGG